MYLKFHSNLSGASELRPMFISTTGVHSKHEKATSSYENQSKYRHGENHVPWSSQKLVCIILVYASVKEISDSVSYTDPEFIQ